MIELVGVNNIWMINWGAILFLTSIGSFLFVGIVRSVTNKLKYDRVLMLFGF